LSGFLVRQCSLVDSDIIDQAGGGESQPLSVTAVSSNPGLIPDPNVTYPAAAADWLTDGLLAHYPFDGNATDQSGNGNDGTVNGATLVEDRFGNVDSAYSFDGMNDYIRYQGQMITANPFTWSVWFNLKNPVTSGNHTFLISQADDPGSNKMSPSLTITDGTLTFGSYDFGAGGNHVQDTTNIALNLGEWYHAVATSDSSGNRNLYVNGTLVGTANWSEFGQVLPNTYFGVRGGLNLNEGVLDGALDDVRIYDRALTTSEVAQLYTPTGTLQFTPVADLHGVATITVTVEDGGLDGDLDTDGDNATFSRTFDVTVNPVNDSTDSLVAYWDFEGDVQDKAPEGTVADDGTLVGAAIVGGGLGTAVKAKASTGKNSSHYSKQRKTVWRGRTLRREVFEKPERTTLCNSRQTYCYSRKTILSWLRTDHSLGRRVNLTAFRAHAFAQNESPARSRAVNTR
jgi:hypothetical protein